MDGDLRNKWIGMIILSVIEVLVMSLADSVTVDILKLE